MDDVNTPPALAVRISSRHGQILAARVEVIGEDRAVARAENVEGDPSLGWCLVHRHFQRAACGLSATRNPAKELEPPIPACRSSIWQQRYIDELDRVVGMNNRQLRLRARLPWIDSSRAIERRIRNGSPKAPPPKMCIRAAAKGSRLPRVDGVILIPACLRLDQNVRVIAARRNEKADGRAVRSRVQVRPENPRNAIPLERSCFPNGQAECIA